MDDTLKKRKPLGFLLIILVIAIIVGAYEVYQNKTKILELKEQNQQASDQQKETIKPVVTQVDINKLPDDFPADIPLEAGAKIEQNYNVSIPGQTQATRIFVSQKTLTENLNLYKSWLTQNGWKIEASLNQTNLKALTGSKGKDLINISIASNQDTKENTVNISYVIRK